MLSHVFERHKEKGQIKGLLRYGIGEEGKSVGYITIILLAFILS
jgi:hypothetical protein